MTAAKPWLLEVRDLRIVFAGNHGETVAVNGLSYTLSAHRTLAIVGDSGLRQA